MAFHKCKELEILMAIKLVNSKFYLKTWTKCIIGSWCIIQCAYNLLHEKSDLLKMNMLDIINILECSITIISVWCLGCCKDLEEITREAQSQTKNS